MESSFLMHALLVNTSQIELNWQISLWFVKWFSMTSGFRRISLLSSNLDGFKSGLYSSFEGLLRNAWYNILGFKPHISERSTPIVTLKYWVWSYLRQWPLLNANISKIDFLLKTWRWLLFGDPVNVVVIRVDALITHLIVLKTAQFGIMTSKSDWEGCSYRNSVNTHLYFLLFNFILHISFQFYESVLMEQIILRFWKLSSLWA